MKFNEEILAQYNVSLVGAFAPMKIINSLVGAFASMKIINTFSRWSGLSPR